MIHIGMHTDNWRTLSGSFQDAVASAKENNLEYIEFGVVDGQDFVQGLGYSPSISLDSNPIKLKRYLDENNLKVSQIDGSYPIVGMPGAMYGIRYARKSIQFAHTIGCPCVDTVDGTTLPPGNSEKELMAMTKENYRQILEWAEDYNIIINVEPHGPFTTNPDTMEQILNFFDTPLLRMNFDTGNTYIAGQDPVKFCQRFIDKISHVHIKDVSKELSDAVRGGETGIAMSESAIGEGVNAENIAAIIQILKNKNWEGVVSIECQGTKRCINNSVKWIRNQLGK